MNALIREGVRFLSGIAPTWPVKLKADGLVQSISSETIRCILQHHKLKPWHSHLWLSAKVRFAWMTNANSHDSDQFPTLQFKI